MLLKILDTTDDVKSNKCKKKKNYGNVTWGMKLKKVKNSMTKKIHYSE
jgi:hypothetical protein